MSDYARASGRAARPLQPVVDNRETAAPELSPAAQARAEQARDFVTEHMPDAVPLIRDLVREGLMPGWRAVQNCRLLPASDQEEESCSHPPRRP
jgi:hypothetical protein